METKYRVGIDVGTYSIGFAAVEVDDTGMPVALLSCMSLIHDSGVDPDQQKRALTRLAEAGVARRTRRLFRNRKKRLIKLDKSLESWGWPTKDFSDYENPYFPWIARASLASGPLPDSEKYEYLSVALRHIARHRGWRNPYTSIQSLYNPSQPSSQFEEIRANLEKKTGVKTDFDITVGQLICLAEFGADRLRGGGKAKDKKKPSNQVKQALISARLQQSDHAREINKICEIQGIPDDKRKEIFALVFAAESPKGAQAKRAGRDPLQPEKYRALKASDSFQRNRIAALIGNLRILDRGETRRLSVEETKLVFDFLVNAPAKVDPTWIDVAEKLGIDRGALRGTATITDDGERAGARPPVHETNRLMESTKIKPLKAWWKGADAPAREAMLKALSNAEVEDFDSESGSLVQGFFAMLDDETHEKLDSVRLPIGRAAYSEDTLRRLTKRMLEEGMDLYEARRAEFGVDSDWAPPAPPIGQPVGNPAVDRVLKAVARWLMSAEDQWGAPQAVVIEHVRDGFASLSLSREYEQDIAARTKRNSELLKQMQEKLGAKGQFRRSDLWRFQSIQRQNCCCAYCGTFIDFKSAEMDHIVPRAGVGSTNTRENLVAVCHQCNLSKSNLPFAVWAESSNRPGVSVREAIERTNHWNEDNGLTSKQFRDFKNAVIHRFKRTTADEPIDNRSLESVAWMANELRARVSQHFDYAGTKTSVYQGRTTAEARGASGISRKLRFIDGVGKSRLDRRHHAVDAAVISLMTPRVSEVLAIRRNLRETSVLLRGTMQWKEYTGETEEHRFAWNLWVPRMQRLAHLLQRALDEDEIAVSTWLRLRPGNGRAHEDTVSPLIKLKVSSKMSVATVDRSATEAQWCALTRDPEFDPKDGLPENPERTIRLHGTYLGPDDDIEFFDTNAGAIKVRGGFAELSRFHHARIYKIQSGKKFAYSMLRVYNYDLRKNLNDDVFTVDLPPQTISVRQAEPKLRKALADGTAEYLGWVVVDDELEVDTDALSNAKLDVIQGKYGKISRWRLDGFYGNTRLRLRPSHMSKEGLPADTAPEIIDILDKRGWVVAVNQLLSQGQVSVVRRTSLGTQRFSAKSGLPTSWKVS